MLTKEEIFEMSVPERLELIESLWESISPEELAVPESHKQALDRALRDYERDPSSGRTWDEVREKLNDRR